MGKQRWRNQAWRWLANGFDLLGEICGSHITHQFDSAEAAATAFEAGVARQARWCERLLRWKIMSNRADSRRVNIFVHTCMDFRLSAMKLLGDRFFLFDLIRTPGMIINGETIESLAIAILSHRVQIAVWCLDHPDCGAHKICQPDHPLHRLLPRIVAANSCETTTEQRRMKFITKLMTHSPAAWEQVVRGEVIVYTGTHETGTDKFIHQRLDPVAVLAEIEEAERKLVEQVERQAEEEDLEDPQVANA